MVKRVKTENGIRICNLDTKTFLQRSIFVCRIFIEMTEPMDRRNFLKKASSFALLTAGAATGVSRVFAHAPLSGTKGETDKVGDKLQPNEKWNIVV